MLDAVPLLGNRGTKVKTFTTEDTEEIKKGCTQNSKMKSGMQENSGI